MDSSHFLAVSSPWVDPLYKTLFLDFWFRPITPKSYSPKLLATTPLRRHPRSRTRQFSSCLEKVGNPLNFRTDSCCHGNEIWPRRGDLDAYRLVIIIIIIIIVVIIVILYFIFISTVCFLQINKRVHYFQKWWFILFLDSVIFRVSLN